MPQPPRDQVLISYSHEDKAWLEKLQTMLKPLVRKNSISIWEDYSEPKNLDHPLRSELEQTSRPKRGQSI